MADSFAFCLTIMKRIYYGDAFNKELKKLKKCFERKKKNYNELKILEEPNFSLVETSVH